MDDISFIAPMSTLRIIANQAADLYDAIGLQLNVQKCFLIAKVPVTLIVNSLEVPFVNYLSSSFRFLGCYLGSHDNIVKDLNVYLDSMRKELDQIKELQLEKHLKFFMLKICYSGKVTHLLRSLPPVLIYNFCRSFNKIRTDFLAFLLSVDPAALNNHIFSDPHLGGIGFTSSKWWTKSAFIGGGKNFVFDFCRRYPSQENLLVSTSSFFLVNLRSELSLISPDLWQTCFQQIFVKYQNDVSPR
ncbi:hypothetical protein GEMRC1_011338 [Eukaryota sp. GEM-RC1]